METSLSELYQRYKPCLARVTVDLPTGDTATGAAFHIGRGYLVTARHNVEGVLIKEISTHHYARKPTKVTKIIPHHNPAVDIAILKTDFSLEHYITKVKIMVGDQEREKTDYIPLGGHLDDWLGDELILSKAMVLGFPHIPRSREVVPVAVESEVNAIVDRYDVPHPYFVISSIPRGGFSGGPVFSEYGFLLGVMTEALFEGDKPYELGFAAAVSIQPLLDLIDEAKIECGENSQFIKELFGDDAEA